jgi:hypothetical protein
MLNKIAIVVIILALAWGLEQVVSGPLETGAVYPEYSSLRSDPMGSMALYESLAKVVNVDRLFKNRAQSDPGKGTTIFVLGIDPVGWSVLEEKSLQEYEDLTAKGARLVIAFLPAEKSWFEEKARPVEKLWDVRFTYKETHAELGEIPHQTGLKLVGGKEWTTIDEGSNALERPLGAGSVVLISDSYPLSNEGLREVHDAVLIAKLAGPAKDIIFDENHFGVAETGSIAKLMRKYHLEGALGILALVAGLFLWRSASSLLPSRAPQTEKAVTGRDSLEGMTALLRRGIAEKDVVRICYDEWRKTGRKSPENGPDEALFHYKNAVAAYKNVAEKITMTNVIGDQGKT